MAEVICDRETCRHCNEDGECARYRINLDEDGLCEDYDNADNPE